MRGLPSEALSAIRAPHAPLVVAHVRHQAGLPDARMQHALLCLVAVLGGL